MKGRLLLTETTHGTGVMDETGVMDDGWDEWGYEGEADQ